MKKIYRAVMAVLAALMISGSAGCSSAEPQNVVPQPEQSQSEAQTRALSDVYADINALGMLPEMYMLEDAYVEGYYGIAAEAIDDKVFAVADDGLLADTVIVVKVSASGDENAIADGFRSVNMNRLAEMESYNPTQYERAEDAEIGCGSGYAWYIITDDNASVMDIINSIIG